MQHARLARLEKLESDLDPAQAWRQRDGLYARLMEHAWRGPWDDLDDDAEPLTSFSSLLKEAREWLADREPA